ncbi:MAG: 2-hydroxyacyl-CoA dehydratase [Chloroflexi bacterium]|nr:2-hydroxyacyl-CoA dehydratase [Chloroflexota bacterium]
MKTLERIRQAVERRPSELIEARARGEKVLGYFCCYIPEEIIDALGLIPVRLGRGGDETLVDLGARYVSTNNCVFIRESVGLFADGKDPYVQNSDFVAVAGTCIQMFRLSELVKYYFKPEVVALGVPRNFYLPEGRVFFRHEMADFVRQVEAMTGRTLEPGRLSESIELYRQIREAILELYARQSRDASPISWRDIFDVVQAGFYLDRRQYLSLLKDLLTEVESVGETAKPNNRPRIFVSGSILAPGDTKIIDLIEQLGGRIVVDDLCTGLRFHKELMVHDHSLDGLADAYLDRIPCASLPCLLPLDEDKRFTTMVQLAKEHRAEGMIYHTLRFCDPFTFKANATMKYMQEKLGVPFLEIHTEYSPSDVEALRTRVESFIDVIYMQREEKEAAAC